MLGVTKDGVVLAYEGIRGAGWTCCNGAIVDCIGYCCCCCWILSLTYAMSCEATEFGVYMGGEGWLPFMLLLIMLAGVSKAVFH